MAGPWFVRSGAGGSANGLSWANASLTLSAAATLSSAGDTIWVADDHAETGTSANTITFPGTAANPTFVYCVDHTQASPGTNDLRKTGTVTTTTTGAITISGSAYVYGLTFSSGSGANSVNFVTANGAGNNIVYDACALNALGTTGGTLGQIATTSITLKNCTVSLNSTSANLATNGRFTWKGGAYVAGSNIPTTLLSNNVGIAFFEGVDLGAIGSATLVPTITTTAPGRIIFKDCRLGSTSVIAASQTGGPGEYQSVDIVRCDGAGTNYRSERYNSSGSMTTIPSVVRTSGASDGVTPESHKFVTNANAKTVFPLEGFPITIWNIVLQNNINVTLEGIADPTAFSALPNNDDFWIDVEYLGYSGAPLGTTKSGTKANALATGTAWAASTQAWDSAATARVASAAYTVGNIIKVGTNTGRLFVCTTSGNASNDASGTAYSSAVDGGTVNESAAGSGGTAVFKAMWRFKMTVTLASPQPQMVGPITVYPKMAKASATVYLDPLITLS